MNAIGSTFRWTTALLLGLLPAIGVFAAGPSLAPNVTPIVNPEKSGAELAARLRSAAPTESSEFQGNLSITTRNDQTTTLPILSVIRPLSNHWTVSYLCTAADGRARDELVITHAAGQPNAYRLRHETNFAAVVGTPPRAGLPGVALAELLPSDQLHRAFAGSDFWICDLGLEFLHWPRQRVLRHEVRSSRSCWVLESRTSAPAPGGYARVVSWIDVEHDGILRAEAYDTAGKPAKEFNLGSLRKVNGRYELESMKMRNLHTGQETELKFELPKK